MKIRHLFSRPLPPLDWIQVEVTSHCNAACIYCPYTVYRKYWQGRHMRLETFMKILPYCSKTSMIHLQGWGEPFLNPDLFEMIRLAKKEGCRVGTTTNGTLTNEECLARIVDLDVDVIAFSLAGTDSSNDEIRKGTRLKQVLKHIECLNRLKHSRQTSKPEIHIAYMLLNPGLEDVEKLPALMQNFDIPQAVISTLDFIPDAGLMAASFIDSYHNFGELQAHLDRVVADGRSRGIEIHYQIPGRERHALCFENVLESLVVSSDGTVSPCVFTNMPLTVEDEDQKGPPASYIPLHFGNIHSAPLNQIWWQKNAKKLRHAFAHHQYLPPCMDCPKRRIVTNQTLPVSPVHDILNAPD